MTIRQIINAMNAHPEIWITVYNVYGDMVLYRGHYDRLTERMLNWTIENFSVDEIAWCKVVGVRIWLEYNAENR